MQMGYTPEEAKLVHEITLLHDIGKVCIDEAILNKREPLTDDEWKIIREHPVHGETILQPLSLEREMLTVVRHHHEWYNGQGYPDQLKAEALHIFSQIVAVADSYDAMTSRRAYREARTRAEAIAELRACSGTQFNPDVVRIFLAVLDEETNA